MIQFPLSTAQYFCYVAPLVFLGTLALVADWKDFDRIAFGSLAAFYLIFALWLHPPGYFDTMLSLPDRFVALAPLKLARAGGLVVKASYAEQYSRLIPTVEAHAHGAYIYCAPNCPEVYFLSSRMNPTGTLFDCLDPDFLTAPVRLERILMAIQDHKVS